MLPVTHGVEFTLTQVLLYTILLTAVTVLPFATGMSGLLYLIGALVLDAIFVGYAVRMKWWPKPGLPMKTFGYRSEEHTSELQSLMRISYAVFCLKKKKKKRTL